MSSSPAVEQSPPTTTPPSPAQRAPAQLEYAHYSTSTPNYTGKRQHPPLNVILPPVGPLTPSLPSSEAAQTPPPRSPGALTAPVASGDTRQPLDGTSSDKSSETAVGGATRTPSAALSRKESYKAQRQHYRREKKRVASALLHSIEDPSVVVLADWLKVRGSLKSWTKLWCVLKPGLLLLYKSPKAKSSHWVGTVLLTSCQVIERPSKKDGFCFKLYHPLEQSIWAPRGPHNETIGAVVQPLPTAHLIFRAPSQAAGHCWLDGLELALRCSNAMLRCSRSRTETSAAAEGLAIAPAHISHEELERHFNEHGYTFGTIRGPSAPIGSQTEKDSVSLCSMPRKRKQPKFFKYLTPTSFLEEGMTRFMTSLPKRRSSTPGLVHSETDLYSAGKVIVTAPSDERVSNCSSTSSDGSVDTRSLTSGAESSRSLLSAYGRKRPNVTECGRSYTSASEDGRASPNVCRSSPNVAEQLTSVAGESRTHPHASVESRTFPNAGTSSQSRPMVFDNNRTGPNVVEQLTSVNEKRRTYPNAPETDRTSPKRSDFGRLTEFLKSKRFEASTLTRPNVAETGRTTTIVAETGRTGPNVAETCRTRPNVAERFSLIDYSRLPSKSYEVLKCERLENRCTMQNVHVAGKIVAGGEAWAL